MKTAFAETVESFAMLLRADDEALNNTATFELAFCFFISSLSFPFTRIICPKRVKFHLAFDNFRNFVSHAYRACNATANMQIC